ncbi:PTS sugar transporter subunit IIA [Alphaproteobacteria bacterium]|nr:PTS sugar transporter subunit IIA [Alphaproteobacteria bacterium]
MIGLVITAHGDLPFALGSTLEHIFGPQSHVRAISINPDDDLDAKLTELRDAVKQTAGDQGVIITTDLFGGTPSNLAMGLAETGKVEVLCGVNLPLLIRIIEMRGTDNLETASQEAQKAGIDHIKRASAFFDLPQPQKEKRA